MDMDDYFRATPDERARIDKQRPPIAQSHRGKPATWTMRGYLDAVKPDRAPTHRADGPPITPARYAFLTNGKTAA